MAEPESRKRARESWGHIIDRIANTAPTTDDALRSWQPADAFSSTFIDAAVRENYINVVAREDAADEAAPGALRFRPQLSFLESMHAKPRKPRSTDAFEKKDSASDVPVPTTSGPNFAEIASLPTPESLQKRADLTLLLGGRFPSLSTTARRVDFMPIILIPRATESLIQMCNVADWLERGIYVSPSATTLDKRSGMMATGRAERLEIRVEPGRMLATLDTQPVKFTTFRVYDDPADVEGEWDRVCACIVIGKTWQFNDWFPDESAGGSGTGVLGGTSAAAALSDDRSVGNVATTGQKATDPGVLFSRVRGFMPYSEEDKVPDELKAWNVVGLCMSHRATKQFGHVRTAALFWEELYKFLSTSPAFRNYTLKAE